MYSVLPRVGASHTDVASNLRTLSCIPGSCRSPSLLPPPRRASGCGLNAHASRQEWPGECLLEKVGYSYAHFSFLLFVLVRGKLWLHAVPRASFSVLQVIVIHKRFSLDLPTLCSIR